MSNQRTPNDKRHRRRRDDSPSRSMFVEIEETKKNRKISDLFNKPSQPIEEPKVKERRTEFNNKNDGIRLSRGNYKTNQIFEADEKGQRERRKRRSNKSTKTIVLFGASFVVLAAAVIGSIFIFTGSNNNEDNNDILAVENTQLKSKVILYYNDTRKEMMTEAETVGDLLEENEIVLIGEQKLSHTEDSLIKDNMEIFISNPMHVSVVQNDITNSVTVYGGRVADVFEQMEIELDENDIIVPSSDTLVEDNMTIQFTDVEVKEISVVEDLPYETEEGETDTVESGYYHVEQDGQKGTVKITYQVKYINDVEESREEVGREVIEEPTDRIILWGTASPSKDNDNDNDNDGGGSNDDDDDNGSVPNPGDQETNPSVPAAPSDYLEIMSGHVTAYTHTGSTTAIGTWPRSTRTLANPGTCAVVPDTIPYGSLLYVTGYGYCIAEDTGAFRHDPDRWNQIDLFMNTRDECIVWGRRRDVKVYIIRKGR